MHRIIQFCPFVWNVPISQIFGFHSLAHKMHMNIYLLWFGIFESKEHFPRILDEVLHAAKRNATAVNVAKEINVEIGYKETEKGKEWRAEGMNS